MRAEKRKAYLSAFMVAVMLLSVPLTYGRVLLSSGRISGQTAADIAGCYGVYADRLGDELYIGGEVPAVLGNLIGFDGVIENALSERYGALLGPRGFNPLTGLRSLESKQGGLLRTTLLPLSSQQRIADGMSIAGESYRGVVFAYNYVTGEVYTALSLPSQGYYTEDALDGAYFNKVINGSYTPGSTMKVAAVLCALQQEGFDLSAFTYDCSGYLKLEDGEMIVCGYPHGYGLTVEDALGLSCNCFIASMASHFDVETTRGIMEQMGFASSEETACARRLDGFSRSTSTMAFQTNYRFADLWGMAGQGETLASPVDMAMIAGAVAADGCAAVPYVVKEAVSLDTGRKLYAATDVRTERLVANEAAQQAREIWKAGYETYYSAGIDAVTYMKTGTAECSDGQINRTLLGVLEEYHTAFFICAEDVWNGCEICFDVLDILVEELTMCLEREEQ